jgi:Protein of unknown function (DUF4232)
VKIRILVAAAALIGLAGCGGGDGTTIGSAQPAPTTAAAGSGTPTSPGPGGSEPAQSQPAPTSPAGSGPTGAGPSSSATGGATSRCHTSELTASFRPSDPAAGNRYATQLLTNHSQRTCTVFGYGGLQPLDAAKKQLPITLTRDTGRPATLVRLAPGTSVGRTIHWGAVPSDDQPCPTPAYASVIPPDETDPLLVRWSLGPVCGGRIDGWPYGVTL